MCRRCASGEPGLRRAMLVRRILLEEDAFAGAHERGLDRPLLELARHRDAGGPATGIAGDDAGGRVTHVRDAVVEQDEQLGAVVGAQPVAGAEVLVDPNPHHTTIFPAPAPRKSLYSGILCSGFSYSGFF